MVKNLEKDFNEYCINNNLEINKIQANALEFSNSTFFEKEKLFQNIEVYVN